MHMRLTVSTRLHVINATMYPMQCLYERVKEDWNIVMPKSAEPISAQRGGIPLNCRGWPTPRNMAYLLQLLYTLDASPDSPLRLATRTGPHPHAVAPRAPTPCGLAPVYLQVES